MQHEFAERAQDQEGKEAADCVSDDEGRARRIEAASGTQEQAGADGTADGDHLDLTRLQALVIARVLGVEELFSGVRL